MSNSSETGSSCPTTSKVESVLFGVVLRLGANRSLSKGFSCEPLLLNLRVLNNSFTKVFIFPLFGHPLTPTPYPPFPLLPFGPTRKPV